MPKTQAQNEILNYIKQHKAIPIDEFMRIAVKHYYANNEPFGEQGDFITSPEISQMFGEMIGIWCIQTWRKLKLEKFSLVEIGGGKGLLMKDLLRATKHDKVFNDNLDKIYMVETSERLKQIQQQEVNDERGCWVDHIDQVPEGNLLVIANEFFDALPIKQYKKIGESWKEIVVVDKDDKLSFALDNHVVDIHDKDILETSLESLEYAKCIAKKLVHGAMLIIDYGYLKKPNASTLQAVKNHKFHDVLKDIGNADITAHVDFAALIEVFNELGFENHITTQGDFLLDQGIGIRAKKLIENVAKEKVIMNQLNRLVHPEQMGELFKVLEVAKENK